MNINVELYLAKDVKPCLPAAKALAEAVLRLIKSDNDLEEAVKKIPKYTAQYSDADYVAAEQYEWNQAAEHLHALLTQTVEHNERKNQEISGKVGSAG